MVTDKSTNNHSPNDRNNSVIPDIVMVLTVLKKDRKTIKMVTANSAIGYQRHRLKQQRGTRHRICSTYSLIRIND